MFTAGGKGALIGGLAGAGLGAAAGGLPKYHTDLFGKKTERTRSQRIGGAIAGGLGMGVVGASYGHDIGRSLGGTRSYAGAGGYSSNRHSAGGGSRYTAPKPSSKPDWLKNAKTKSDARKAYHAQARKAHPDAGGSEEAMKNLNNEWDAHSGSYKTAMISAFADELAKIAMAKTAGLGAIAGGAAGWAMGPSSLKGKLVSTAVGAGVGHMAGAGVNATKKAIWDEPRAREHEELYGYQPAH